MDDLTKEDAQELFNYLEKRRTTNNSSELLDIMDVLLQVIKISLQLKILLHW